MVGENLCRTSENYVLSILSPKVAFNSLGGLHSVAYDQRADVLCLKINFLDPPTAVLGHLDWRVACSRLSW